MKRWNLFVQLLQDLCHFRRACIAQVDFTLLHIGNETALHLDLELFYV